MAGAKTHFQRRSHSSDDAHGAQRDPDDVVSSQRRRRPRAVRERAQQACTEGVAAQWPGPSVGEAGVRSDVQTQTLSRRTDATRPAKWRDGRQSFWRSQVTTTRQADGSRSQMAMRQDDLPRSRNAPPDGVVRGRSGGRHRGTPHHVDRPPRGRRELLTLLLQTRLAVEPPRGESRPGLAVWEPRGPSRLAGRVPSILERCQRTAASRAGDGAPALVRRHTKAAKRVSSGSRRKRPAASIRSATAFAR